MVAAILLTVFGALFALMAVAPLAIEESERVEATRRQAIRTVPVPIRARCEKASDHEPVAA